jgi:isopenicillin N synthase-like dioxygenase
VIDLSSIRSSSAARQVYDACRTFGFFQVTGHGVDPRLVDDLRSEARRFFVGAPRQAKERLRRSQDNARGYFDDELTRRKRDWKECLDAGVPGSRSWGAPDDGPANACLDGCNRFPHDGPGGRQRLREAFVAYFEACSRLSGRIAALMAAGLLGSAADGPSGRSALEQASDEFLRRMKDEHTSYLRLNYYPPCRPGEGEKGRRANTDATRMKEDEEEDDEEEDNAPRPLGVRAFVGTDERPYCRQALGIVWLTGSSCLR